MTSLNGPTWSTARLGYWSAFLTAFCCIVFTVDAVLTETHLFMCLSTLVAAPAFWQNRLQRWIRWLFLVNGILAVSIILTYFVNRSFIWMTALWSVTITGSAILLAIHFRRVGRVRRPVDRS